MQDAKLYEELGRYLDQGIVGTPRAPALIEILKILFPGEEAEVALRLPMQDKSLPELRELFHERADAIEEILNRMVKRGTVFVSGSSPEERKYRLLPSVVGWSETPYWAGKDTEDAIEVASRRLRIQVRTRHHGACPEVAASPVYKEVADRVDADRVPPFLGPANQQSPRFSIFRRKGLTGDAAAAGRAYLRNVHMPLPETAGINGIRWRAVLVKASTHGRYPPFLASQLAR